MIKASNQPVVIPILTLKPPPSAPSTVTFGSSFQIPHYSHKKAFHKDCFSFAGVIYAGLNVNTNPTSGSDEIKYSEMVKQRTNSENREFFEQFLFKKNRRGLFNCLTVMEKIKYELTFESQTITSIVRIYEKIIRKYLINVVDIKNSDNIDTVLSSSAHSLLGISREMQRKTCEKFENFIRVQKDWTELWNSLFTSVKFQPIVEEQQTVPTMMEVSNETKSAQHEKTNSLSLFFRRFSMRPNKNASPSSSVKDEHSYLTKVEEPSIKRKRGNSMTFRFKSLKDEEVKELYQTYQVQSENYGLKLDEFMEIFDQLNNELIKQLKILFDQYVEDSDEYEMFLIDRIQKRNPTDFPEVFSKSNPKGGSTGALLSVNTNQSKTPSPITSSLTREHSFPPTLTNSSEEISTSESMSPVSPSNDQSPIHTGPIVERPKLSIPIIHRNSSEFEHDYSEPLASPRKLKTLFSVEEKKKKKKEKEKTVKKVQTIQEQMNKYNKIISSLYKDLIERESEIQTLKLELVQFESSDLCDDETMTEEEEIQSFEEIL